MRFELFIGALVALLGASAVAHATESGAAMPVEKIAAKKSWGGHLPTWREHARKGTDSGKWNSKCSAGRARARNNPHGATTKAPACIRV